jgi:hypothetical protein
MSEAKEVKRFFCGSNEVCVFKESFINNRCFAIYSVRQSCPRIIRKDGLNWLQGSKEEEVLVK